MCKNLTKVSWKLFSISNIFEKINIAKSLDYGKLKKGETTFIGRQESNNGIQGFVTCPISEIGNCITIGMVGEPKAFWQSYDFATSQNILILRNQLFNKYSAIFICSILNKYILTKYNYGRPIKLKTFPKDKIMLPVNSKEEPDYEFMEKYIREKETKLKQEYKTYIQKQVVQIQKKVDIENKEWKNFKLSKIFTFDKGNQNNMGSLQNGNIPLVSAKKVDNGYKDFVSKNNKKIFKGSCISLNNDGDGGAGIAYYQPYKMLLDSHCTALIPKLALTKETLIFLSRAITKQRNKFGHGYPINKKRLKIFQIMLPINSKNEPDYEFMHDYMLYLEQKKILEYLE